MREKDIEKKLRDGVKKRGGWCVKWTSPGTDGVPDRIIFLPGLQCPIFCELKTETGGLSAIQRHVLGKLSGDFRQFVIVLHGAAEVQAFLESIDKKDAYWLRFLYEKGEDHGI